MPETPVLTELWVTVWKDTHNHQHLSLNPRKLGITVLGVASVASMIPVQRRKALQSEVRWWDLVGGGAKHKESHTPTVNAL